MESKIYARNKAEYNYFIEDKYEAGMVQLEQKQNLLLWEKRI